MPRKTIKSRKAMRPVLHESLRFYLETGVYATRDRFPDCPARAETFLLAGSSSEKQVAVWQANKDIILTDWIKKYPCSRPWAFWDLDIKEIRQRVGGVGDLWNEWKDYGPHECFLGIPSAWVSVFDEAYYNGKAKNIHGKIISSPFKEGDFKRTVVDPKDPPTFESQAKYLDRLDFLTPAEKIYLKNHPELMESEKIEFEEDEDD